MKIKFIGVGGAFTTKDYWQSNAVVTAASGKHLLLDCGGYARFSLQEQGLSSNDIDAVYKP